MQGDLRTTSLEQLCRTLDERAASGELAIQNDARSVNVWFRQGRVVRAQSSDHQMRLGDRLVHGGLITAEQLSQALATQRSSGHALGEVLVDEGMVNRHVVRVFTQEQVLDSMFACVRWTGGTYEFHESEIDDPAVPTDLTVAQLLFALESRHRRWDEITRTIPDLDAVPEFVPGADPMSASLEPGEATIVSAVDGRRSLEQISDDLGFGAFEVATVVHGLAVLGLIRLTDTASMADGGLAPEPDEPRAPERPASPVGAAGSALSEATALLLGDEPPAGEDSDDGIRLNDLADLADAGAAPAPAQATASGSARAVDPTPTATPEASDDTGDDTGDDDIAPWAFTIEGDDEDDDAAEPERRRVSTPITSGAVADAGTGTPLPVAEPSEPAGAGAPEPDSAREKAAPDKEASAPEPQRPRTGEMSDLLRELRQLSGE